MRRKRYPRRAALRGEALGLGFGALRRADRVCADQSNLSFYPSVHGFATWIMQLSHPLWLELDSWRVDRVLFFGLAFSGVFATASIAILM